MIRRFTSHLRKVIPVRCRICGSWGHGQNSGQWVCDICYARLFQKDPGKVFRPETGEKMKNAKPTR